MIVEERIYTLHPGKLEPYLEIYEAEGLAVQTRYLQLVGFFVSEMGPLNQIVHLWAYESFDARMSARAALRADPEWRSYAPKTRSFIARQENKILLPTHFSPMRWTPEAGDGHR